VMSGCSRRSAGEESGRALTTVTLSRTMFTLRTLPAIRPISHLVADGNMAFRRLGAAVVTVARAAEGAVVASDTDAIDSDGHLG